MRKFDFTTLLARIDTLEHRVLGYTRRRETRAERARRKGVSTRTITRRVDAGTEDQPDIINGRWYFWVDEADKQPPPDTPAARAARNPRLRKPTQNSPEI
jgi:hypothetical protein